MQGGGAGGYDVGGVEVLVEGVGLAGVYHEEHFVVSDSLRRKWLVGIFPKGWDKEICSKEKDTEKQGGRER